MGERPDVNKMITLKVDNIPHRAHPEDVKDAFSRYGEIGDVYIPRDHYTQQSRGFAFVRYLDRRDAEDAAEKMDGQMFQGRDLRVQFAQQRRPENPREFYRERGGGRGGRDGGRDGYRRRDSRDRYDDRRRGDSRDRRRRDSRDRRGDSRDRRGGSRDRSRDRRDSRDRREEKRDSRDRTDDREERRSRDNEEERRSPLAAAAEEDRRSDRRSDRGESNDRRRSEDRD